MTWEADVRWHWGHSAGLDSDICSPWRPIVMEENWSPPSPSLVGIFLSHLVTLSAAHGVGVVSKSRLVFCLLHACYAKLPQLCLTLCNPLDCSPPGSSVHGILQARVLECPPPADLPNLGIKPACLTCPHWQAGSLPLNHLGSPLLLLLRGSLRSDLLMAMELGSPSGAAAD